MTYMTIRGSSAWFYVASVYQLIVLVQGPCYECMIYDNQVKQEPSSFQDATADKLGCPYQCSCSSNPPGCKTGIPQVKDGCNCCSMCARQQGEPCSHRLVCDISKQLVCHYVNHTSTGTSAGQRKGFCKKTRGFSCSLNGNIYADGTHFSTDCRHKCICLNGRISCTDICHSQEALPPPEAVCPGPVLFQPNGQCCKQWQCSRAHKQIIPVNIQPPLPGSLKQEQLPGCTQTERHTTEWSACSKFCGVGLSTRYTTDNLECRNITENRICQWRPCSMDDYLLGNSKCKPTVRTFRHVKLTFTLNITDSSMAASYGTGAANEGSTSRQVMCRSVRSFRPKFCSTCFENHCCLPEKTKTKSVQFVCENGQTYFKKWEWVKKCVCRPGKCNQ